MARTKGKTVAEVAGDGDLEYRLKKGVGSHRVRGGKLLLAGGTIRVDHVSELGSFADKFELVSGTVVQEEEVPALGFRRFHKGGGKHIITKPDNKDPLHNGTLTKAEAIAVIEGGQEALDALIEELGAPE